MRGWLNTFQPSAHVPRVRMVNRIVGAGMSFACTVENSLRFSRSVRLPYFLYVQNGEHDAFGVAQRDLASARRQFLGELLRHVESDRHRPKHSARQMHVVANAFVVGL